MTQEIREQSVENEARLAAHDELVKAAEKRLRRSQLKQVRESVQQMADRLSGVVGLLEIMEAENEQS